MRYTLPDYTAGYELDPINPWFSVVMPEETTNLLTNPSFETDDTNVSATNATYVRSTVEARRGVYSLAVTPLGANLDVYILQEMADTAFAVRTFSADVKGIRGDKYRVGFMSTDETEIYGVSQSYVATGEWQRLSVTAQRPWSVWNNYKVFVQRVRAVGASVSPFYTDGWQIEGKAYPTTYCDGSGLDGHGAGFFPNRLAEYSWTGTDHASTSIRASTTRSGGKEVPLADYGFRLTSIVGLGMGPVDNISLEMNSGAEYYDKTRDLSRTFTLVGAIYGSSLQALYKNKKNLINSLRRDLTIYDQPLYLKFQYINDCGEILGKTLYIKCMYEGGLEGATDNLYQEKIGIQFRIFDQYIEEDGNDGDELFFGNTITAPNFIIRRSNLNVWHDLGTGSNGRILTMCTDGNGDLYVGGSFTEIDSVPVNHVAKYTVATDTWSALGDGLDEQVTVLRFSPRGILYAAGYFDNTGATPCHQVAKYKTITNAWEQVGTGIGEGLWASSLSWDNDGNTYLSRYDGIYKCAEVGAWSRLGDMLSYPGDVLYVREWDTVIVADPLGGVKYWNESETGGRVGWNNVIHTGTTYPGQLALAATSPARFEIQSADPYNVAGMLFIGSQSTGGEIPYLNIFKMRLSKSYSPGIMIGSLTPFVDTEYTGITDMEFGENQRLYVCGSFLKINGVTFPSAVAYYQTGMWHPIDLSMPVGTEVDSMTFSKNKDLYLGINNTGVINVGTVTPIAGSTVATPIDFYITGPGTLGLIINNTTGKVLNFGDLVIEDGEVITGSTYPDRLYLRSSYYGDITGRIIAGTDYGFGIVPGSNSFTVQYHDTSADSHVYIMWKNKYRSIEESIYG